MKTDGHPRGSQQTLRKESISQEASIELKSSEPNDHDELSTTKQSKGMDFVHMHHYQDVNSTARYLKDDNKMFGGGGGTTPHKNFNGSWKKVIKKSTGNL